MAQAMRVNPNRMELLKLRRRLEMARRGHKLLKDKLDELLREFLERIGANRRLRSEAERALFGAYGELTVARAEAGASTLAQSLASGEPTDLLSTSERNVMSVRVPEFEVGELPRPSGYSLLTTPTVLDSALESLGEVAPRLIELAQREKTIELLAAEIERTRRRVNALEYVLIPQLTDAVRFIQMKLDEIERSNVTRLLKIKDIVAGAGKLV